MKKNMLLLLILFSLPFVFSEAPPALPMVVWGEADMDGNSVSDGLAVQAINDGKNYAQEAFTRDGQYEAIIINGDRPLTYNDDPNCERHDPCIPCIQGYGPDHQGQELEYCIEGPQDGSDLRIEINDTQTIPIIIWNNGSVARHDLIVIKDGIMNFSITLTSGWNLISIPLLPLDSSIESIMEGCDYNRIWEYNQGWTSTDSGLTSLNELHGYWVDRIGLSGDCEITIAGTLPEISTIEIDEGWTLVGYPSLTPRSLTSLFSDVSYTRIWEYNQGWTSTDSGLTQMKPGEGYWIDSESTGSYEVKK